MSFSVSDFKITPSPLPEFSNQRLPLPRMSYEDAPVQKAIELTDSLDPQPKLRQLRQEPVKPVTEIQEGKVVNQFYARKKGHTFTGFMAGICVCLMIAVLGIFVIGSGGWSITASSFMDGLSKLGSLFV